MESGATEIVEERGAETVRAVDLERLRKMPLEALLYWVLRGGRRAETV
jgi:hypothetical protein